MCLYVIYTFDQFYTEDMVCTVEEVKDALKRLDITKASGPDYISARML